VTQDLSRVGRDLSKAIIIDNVYENFQLQTENGILIRSWFDDPDDIALSDLTPLLREVAIKKVDDVRKALKILRDQMMEQINNGEQEIKLSL
jgi:CTD small phosphatase-like protein 2